MLHDFAAGSWQLNHRGVCKRGSRRFPGERNLIDWGEVFDDLQNPFTCPLISLNLTICELKVWGTWFRATSHCGKGVLLEETVIFFKWMLSKETLIQRYLNPKKPYGLSSRRSYNSNFTRKSYFKDGLTIFAPKFKWFLRKKGPIQRWTEKGEFFNKFCKKKKKNMTTVDTRRRHGAMWKLEPHWWTYLGFDILGSIFRFPLFQR